MSEDELVPVLAHGARMSWAGLLRDGDPFPASVRSRRAVVTALRGPPVRRYFGGWSSRYRRFTSNLSAIHLRVAELSPGAPAADGIEAIVHRIPAVQLDHCGPGSVAAGDGWPSTLWEAFLAHRPQLGEGSVGERLRRFADSSLAEEVGVVRAWRALLRSDGDRRSSAASVIGGAWVPITAELATAAGSATCLVSWSPSPREFESLTSALRSEFAEREALDLDAQARYYLECRLAALHGVRFSADDRLVDRAFEAGPAVRDRRAPMTALEEARIGDPRYGRLDRRGGPVTARSDR